MNNKKISTTLLCLALGGGYSYMKRYTDNLTTNRNDEKTIINSIFVEKEENTKKEEILNTPKLYSENERKKILEDFKLKQNYEPINSLKEEYSSKSPYYNFKINNLKIQYKIIIEFKIDKTSLIPISFNNFKHIICTNNNNKIIFDNIIFKENDNLIISEFDEIEPKEYSIIIKPTEVNYKNGIFIINNNPYYFIDNYLPTTVL